jgi:pimeloyl-ACP methyl ester carboxylesterase
MEPDFEEQSVRLPGLRMHSLACGPAVGPKVVLLHGFPELAESWRGVMTPLAAQGFRVIAPDLRGYGRTERPETGYDINTLGRDIAGLIRSFGKERVHLVGHDWGGAIAYHVAAMFPGLIGRLAVVNCPHPLALMRELRHFDQLRRSWYMFAFLLPWLPERMLTRGGGWGAAGILRRLAMHPERLSDERLAPYRENFATVEGARAALAYYRGIFKVAAHPEGRKLLSRYPEIKAPFRLVWGARDPVFSPKVLEGWEPYFEGPVEVRRLPDEGHFVHLEAPDEVAALLAEHFANRTPAAAATAP